MISLFTTLSIAGSIYWVIKQDPVLQKQIQSEFAQDVVHVREFSGFVLQPDFDQVCGQRGEDVGYKCFFKFYLTEFSRQPYGLGGMVMLAAVGIKFVIDERPVNSFAFKREKILHWLGYLRLQLGPATSRSQALPVLVERVQGYLSFVPGIARRCRWGYESLRVPASQHDFDAQAREIERFATSK